jgi:hypothetical protein
MPRTPNTLTPQWEIATACDISLGRLFEEDSGLHGCYIDIDAGAIANSLRQLDPESEGGEVIFMAAHDYNKELAMRDANGITQGGMLARKKPAAPVQVMVGIGGSVNTMFLREDTVKAGKSSSTDNELDNLVARKGTAASTSQAHKRIKPSQVIHETTVHELQHVVDFVNKSVVRKERFFTTKLEAQESAIVTAEALGIFATSEVLMHQLTECNNLTNTVIGSALMVAYMLKTKGGFAARQFIAKSSSKLTFSSPMEKRAYNTAKTLHLHEEAVSIKTL